MKEIQVQDLNKQINPTQICRAVIYEHENVGYFKRGNRLEIRGLIQKIKMPSTDTVIKSKGWSNPEDDLFQIIVGTFENYGDEYVKNLEI